MAYKLNVIPYTWNGHACYIGKIYYKEVPMLIDDTSDLSMNRKIDPKRVEEIKDYIINDIPATFFPPTILNSKAKLSFGPSNLLNVKSGIFTIIDGQHRIRAIKNLIEDDNELNKKQLEKMELPILIIEGLENYQHRDLFYMINETPKNVESNVSERFAPKLENIMGLSFFSQNKNLVDYVEWHEKQSKEKIVYLHITDCIRELNRILYSSLKDWYSCERNMLYKESSYLNIITFYWKIYFELLDEVKNKAFFRKKITLRALLDYVYMKIEEVFMTHLFSTDSLKERTDKIHEIIKESLEMLMKDPLIEYNGIEYVRKDAFKSVKNFLVINSNLEDFKQEKIDNEPLRIVITKIFNISTYDSIYSFEEEDLEIIRKNLKVAFRIKDSIAQVNEQLLSDISIDKEIDLAKIITELNNKE